MANQEHLDLLKQGAKVWNQWREKHPDIQPDLSRADLTNTHLAGANLRKANLYCTGLNWANLKEANLIGADLNGVDLNGANLTRANLAEAFINYSYLMRANLSKASLHRATLRETDLSEANFTGAYLTEADFSDARVGGTIFVNVDLVAVKGLTSVRHTGPSYISVDTIYRSNGRIPELFLQGIGLPELFLTYMQSLISSPIDYYTCFISYSSMNDPFAKRLHADLQSKGVRCWFAPEDMKIGDKIRPRIDESIHLYDKLLLVLSEHSVASQWVEQEVETALEKERRENRTVLFPIRLDNAVMEIEGGWPALIRNTRNIGDFTHWKEHDTYQKVFERLLRDLKAETAQGGA